VRGQHNNPSKIHGKIQQTQVIIIPGHEVMIPIMRAESSACIKPSMPAIIHPTILHGIKQKQVKIKQIAPKQNNI
jgi:hypothetical protein